MFSTASVEKFKEGLFNAFYAPSVLLLTQLKARGPLGFKKNKL